MLIDLKDLLGFKIASTDDEFGKVDDFYFDDMSWTVRYLVVDTGPWLFGRKVLISPIEIGIPNTENKVLPVSLNREQIQNSPDITTDLPLSQRHEASLASYWGWGAYWTAMATSQYRPLMPEPVEPEEPKDRPNLRSVKEIAGYIVRAALQKVGSVDDFIADTRDWKVRYLVIHTGDWLASKKVLLAADWVFEVDWNLGEVSTDLAPDQIRSAPEYDPDIPLTREYEQQLYEHYGKPGYWEAEEKLHQAA